MRRTFLLFSICTALCCDSICAQQIEGSAIGYEGRTLRVYRYAEFITESMELVEEVKIDELGTFRFHYPTETIDYLRLEFDRTYAHLYVEPSREYKVSLGPPNYLAVKTFGRPAQTELIFDSLPLEDINRLIIDFNLRYEQFFSDHYELLRDIFAPGPNSGDTLTSNTRQEDRSLNRFFGAIKTFESKSDSIYRAYDGPFFLQYRKAVFADLMMNSPADRRELFEEYLIHCPFSNSHKEASKSNARFFADYAEQFAERGYERVVLDLKSASGLLNSLQSMMSEDDLLPEESRQDQVKVLFLTESWRNGSMPDSLIARALEIIVNTGHPEARESAKAVLSQLNHRSINGEIRDLKGRDLTQEVVSLDDIEGEYRLLSFWASWCSTCRREFVYLEALRKELPMKVYAVNMDMQYSDFSQALEGKPDLPGRTDVYLGEDPLWMQRLGIRSLPHYIIVDEQGQRLHDEAFFTIKDAERYMKEHMSKQKKEERPRVGRKEN